MRLQLRRIFRGLILGLFVLLSLVSFRFLLFTHQRTLIPGGQLSIRSLILPAEVMSNGSQEVRSKRQGWRLHTRPLVNWSLITDRAETIHSWDWGSLPAECKNKTYSIPDKYKVSVVLTYHEQEKLLNVIHTIHSIVQRTDPARLQEIVLVDDFSKKGDEGTLLQNHLISVFRGTQFLSLQMKEHVGLIKARLAGFRAASAPIIVSMDSHMEVQHGWLEPLLAEISVNRKTLAASYLDWIEPKAVTVDGRTIWNYQHGGSTWRTYFDWNFLFGFQDISAEEKQHRKNPTEPVVCPVTVGTIFAIEKKFFTEIGEFDEAMRGWGGENLDLPIRVWMCGGRVINVPCSHAGHKEEPTSRDYRLSWKEMMVTNYKRVVEVWFDEYKSLFYDYYPEAKNYKTGDVSSRRIIRERCSKPFSWFLNHTLPQLGAPEKDGLAWGGVMNLGTKQCIATTHDNAVGLETCGPYPDSQGIFWSKQGHLRYPVHILEILDEEEGIITAGYMPYYNNTNGKLWVHWKDGPLVHMDKGKARCLQGDIDKRLHLVSCNFQTENQKWRFRNYTSTDKISKDGKYAKLYNSMKDIQKMAGVT